MYRPSWPWQTATEFVLHGLASLGWVGPLALVRLTVHLSLQLVLTGYSLSWLDMADDMAYYDFTWLDIAGIAGQ